MEVPQWGCYLCGFCCEYDNVLILILMEVPQWGINLVIGLILILMSLNPYSNGSTTMGHQVYHIKTEDEN